MIAEIEKLGFQGLDFRQFEDFKFEWEDFSDFKDYGRFLRFQE